MATLQSKQNEVAKNDLKRKTASVAKAIKKRALDNNCKVLNVQSNDDTPSMSNDDLGTDDDDESFETEGNINSQSQAAVEDFEDIQENVLTCNTCRSIPGQCKNYV